MTCFGIWSNYRSANFRRKKKNDILYDRENVAYWSSYKQNLGTLADSNINMTQITCILQSQTYLNL